MPLHCPSPTVPPITTRALVAVAVVVVPLAVVPASALGADGRLHGPSADPLIVELILAAVVALGILGRHAAARLARSVVHAAAAALRSLAQHRPHRARPPSP